MKAHVELVDKTEFIGPKFPVCNRWNKWRASDANENFSVHCGTLISHATFLLDKTVLRQATFVHVTTSGGIAENAALVQDFFGC